MTAHDHREYVEGCYRCDLSRDETAHLTGDLAGSNGRQIGRAELIEAGARAIMGPEDECPSVEAEWSREGCRTLAEDIIDAIAPLIADALDAIPARYKVAGNPGSRDPYFEGYDDGIGHAATAVRSLLGDTDGDR